MIKHETFVLLSTRTIRRAVANRVGAMLYIASNRVSVRVVDKAIDQAVDDSEIVRQHHVLEVSIVANHQDAIDLQFALRRILSTRESASTELGVAVYGRPVVWTTRIAVLEPPVPQDAIGPPIAQQTLQTDTISHSSPPSHTTKPIVIYTGIAPVLGIDSDTEGEVVHAADMEGDDFIDNVQTKVAIDTFPSVPLVVWIWLIVTIPITCLVVCVVVVLCMSRRRAQSGIHKKKDNALPNFNTINAEQTHRKEWLQPADKQRADVHCTYAHRHIPLMPTPITRLGLEENVEILRRMPMYTTH